MTMLVSCILPTKGRHALAMKAVRCFCEQTHQDRELIVLDDSEDRSFPGGQHDMPACNAQIIYLTHNSKSIAEKRNLCCEHAFGELICHTDSDDWSAPDRISHQVKLAEESGKAVVGYSSMLFFDDRDGRAWKFIGHSAVGTSLCYRREFWHSHRFRFAETYHPNCGEDGIFVDTAMKCGELAAVDGHEMMVARIHSGSTSPHNLGPTQQSYRPIPIEFIPKAFFS